MERILVKLNIAFLGLGVMGYPMAGHISNAGHNVTVYNRTKSKSKNWCSDYKGQFSENPKDAVVDADIVFACVGNDNDIREICTGEKGAFEGMKSKTVFVDHTTASADVARELNSIALSKELSFIDAPVSGGQAGAENGKLTVMAGGDKKVFDRVKNVIGCYSQAVTLMGDIGSGQLTKMVNQICIAGLLQGLSEGINFAKLSGLNIEQVVSVISKGAAGSWQMENRAVTMGKGEFNFGFATQWMHKDLQICLEESIKNNAKMPITKIIDQYYLDLINRGDNRSDTSSLIKLLK